MKTTVSLYHMQRLVCVAESPVASIQICVNGAHVNLGLNVQFAGFTPRILTDTDLQALVPYVFISHIATFCINYR